MDGYIQSRREGALRLFYAWKVFDKIPLQRSISYEDLAERVNTEVSLISMPSFTTMSRVVYSYLPMLPGRLTGILITTDILEQLGSDRISHTPRSLVFVSGNPSGELYENAQVHHQGT